MSKLAGKVLISTFALITGLSAIGYANFVYTFNSTGAPSESEQPHLIKSLDKKHFLAFIENVEKKM